MADDTNDPWAALAGIATNVGTYFMQQQQLKAQLKIAKAMGGGGGLPTMAMGYSAAPLGPGSMYGLPPGSQTYLPALPGMGQPVPMVTGDVGVPGSGGSAIPVTGYRTRMPTYAMDIYGRPSRPLGKPLGWTGDLAAVRRIGKLARKLGRYVHHRRPR